MKLTNLQRSCIIWKYGWCLMSYVRKTSELVFFKSKIVGVNFKITVSRQHLTRFRSPAGPGCREYYHSLRWIRTWTWICPGLWTCSCTRGSSSAPACPRCGSWTCCNLSCCRRLWLRPRARPGLWSSRCSFRPWPGFRQSECRPDPSQRPRRPCYRKYNRKANDHIHFP